MLPAFRQLIFPENELVKRFQDNVAAILAKLTGPSGIPFLDGVRVQATLAVGANTITHKLGRTPQGWIVTDLSAVAAVTLYRPSAFTPTTLSLTASAAATVVLWVF